MYDYCYIAFDICTPLESVAQDGFRRAYLGYCAAKLMIE